MLNVLTPRYRRRPFRQMWRHDLQAAASTRGKLSREGIMLAGKPVVIDRMSLTRIAANLGVAWNTAHDTILVTAQELFINSPNRLDRVTTIGLDKHVWRHARFGDKFATVVVDLTPRRTRTGPSRLLAVVEDRSKKVFKTWFEAQVEEFRDGVEVVAMDGFTGYKNAAVAAIETVKIGMGPFHVITLAGIKLDES